MSESVSMGSHLIDGMNPEFWGSTSYEIKVLEIPDFIEQWIRLDERGDTVLVGGLYSGNDRGPIYAYMASDWSLDRRKEINDQFARHAPLLEHEPRPPKGPIPRQKAEEKVGAVLCALVNVELYSKLNRAQKLVQFFRYMRGRHSLYPEYSDRISAIPDYISFNNNARPEEFGESDSWLILVNGESEKAYNERSGKFRHW